MKGEMFMISFNKRNKPTLLYLANSFSVDSGGRTTATFNRAELLKDYASKSAILTFNYKVDYGIIFEKLKNKNNISDEILHLNIYEFFADEPLYKLIPNQSPVKFNKDNYTNCEQVKELLYRVTNKDGSFFSVQLNIKGEVHYINFYDDKSNRYKVEHYDMYGKLRKRVYFDVSTKKWTRVLTYTMNERLFLSVDYEVETGNVAQCIVYDKKGNSQHYFRNEKHMNEYWLAKVKEIYNNPIFFVEDRNLDYLVRDNRYQDIFKSISVMHSSHLKKPYTYGSEVNDFNGRLLNKMSKHSAIVFLTKEQLKHVKKEFGAYNHLFHIPHFLDEEKLKKREEENEKKIVVISRLVELKRIMDILEAFREVVKVIPEAKLELWGKGEEETKYKKYIDQYNLSESIFLKGYATDSYQVFSQAIASVITSKYEGFGLTILESLSSGVPVISYDFNYGPRELIINNKNGFIIENGNINELSQKIIEVLSDDKKTKRMSDFALNSIDHYNKNVIKEQWKELLDYVSKADNKDFIIQPQKILSSYMCTYKETELHEKVTISMNVKNNLSNGIPNEKYYIYIKENRNQEMITKMYFDAEIVSRNSQVEVIATTFDLTKADYLSLNESGFQLFLGVANGKRFSFYPIINLK